MYADYQTRHWIAIFAAIALFCVMQALFWLKRLRLRAKEAQVKNRVRGQQGPEAEGQIRIRDVQEQRTSGAFALLHQAGIENPTVFVARSAVLNAGLILLIAVAMQNVMGGLIVGAAGLFLTYTHVARRALKRLRALEQQLPRALEMLVFSLRAGQALEGAIRVASEEVSEPLASELRRCAAETEMGRPVEEALQNLRNRWNGVQALYALVEAICVLKKTGGNLIEVLERLSDNLHAQAIYHAKFRAMTAQGRMSAMMLMGMPIFAAAAQVLLMPGQLNKMMENPSGQKMVIAAAVLWLLGALWVSRLTKLKT